MENGQTMSQKESKTKPTAPPTQDEDMIDITGDDAPKRNLFQKLNDIKAAFAPLEKDGANAHFKYNYVTEAQVMTRLKELCVDNGVFISVNCAGITRADNVTVVNMTYKLIDIDNPQDTLEVNFPGIGNFTDKGGYAAMTGSYKYFALKTFQLATDDDPENDAKHPEQTKQQAGTTFKAGPARQAISGGDPQGTLGDEVVQFGKWKGKTWSQLNNNYLEWLCKQEGKFQERAVEEVRRREVLTMQGESTAHNPREEQESITYDNDEVPF